MPIKVGDQRLALGVDAPEDPPVDEDRYSHFGLDARRGLLIGRFDVNIVHAYCPALCDGFAGNAF